MTHAAIPPNSASTTSEITVMITEVPNAYQKLKFELLTTEERFVISCLMLTPSKPTGLATILFAFLNVFITTR
jgi:hypothetical protein